MTTELRIYRITIQLKPPGQSGTQSDAYADAPAVIIPLLSTLPMTPAAAGSIVSLANSHGFAAEVFIDNALLVEGDPSQLALQAVDHECRAQLGVDDEGAKPDPDDARMNDLERTIRNQGRDINKLTEVVMQLAGSLGSLVASQHGAPAANSMQEQVISTLPKQSVYAPAGMPPDEGVRPVQPQLNENQIKAAGAGRPLIGTPPPFEGNMSAPLNPRSRGGSQTAEMASGQMTVHGAPPTTTILQFTGVNGKGEGEFVKQPVGVVGTSLLPNSSKSDIVG